MPVKSVIDIEINDQKFKEFASLFAKYRQSVKDAPGDWADINEKVGETQGLFEGLLAGMLTQHQLASGVAKQEKSIEQSSRGTAGHWKDMAKSTKTVAGNIFNATQSLLKWVGLTSVFTGLLGAGGLYGIDRMAAGVASGRKSSLGLGTSYGGQKAFNIAYGPLLNDPSSLLASINEARGDYTKRGLFLGAQMSPSDWQHGDTATVAVNFLDHLKRIVDRAPEGGLQNILQARGLDGAVSYEEAKRLRDMAPEDYRNYRARFEDEHKRLDLTRGTQSAWTDFTQQMHEAGVAIENTFVKALVPLEPQLKKLSQDFVKLVEDFGNSDVVKQFIDMLDGGLKRLDTWLRDPATMKSFNDSLAEFAKGMREAASFLHKVFGKETIAEYIEKYPQDASKMLFSPSYSPTPLLPRAQYYPGGSALMNANRINFGAENFGDVGAAAMRNGLSPMLLFNLITQESKWNPKAKSGRGAMGLSQLMPGTASDLGVFDPYNAAQSVEGGGLYLGQLLRKYKDVDKALAAYNWGQGNLDKDLADSQRYNRDWRGALPMETKEYIGKVENGISQSDIRALAAAVSKGSTVNVRIYNDTGSNISTSTAMVNTP